MGRTVRSFQVAAILAATALIAFEARFWDPRHTFEFLIGTVLIITATVGLAPVLTAAYVRQEIDARSQEIREDLLADISALLDRTVRQVHHEAEIDGALRERLHRDLPSPRPGGRRLRSLPNDEGHQAG